jgi:RNA polymerase sigma factor (sigma-70 family)
MSNHTENQKRLSGLFAREYDNLVAFVKRYWHGNEQADAEDIVQDVILNLYTKVDFNRPVENLIAYTYRSLKNRVIDWQRKRSDKVLSAFDDEESGENRLLRTLASDDTDPELEKEKEANLEQMLDLIDELRPDQQEIIILTELEGYTFDELSKEWGVPLGTLLSRKHRAIAKLQKLMKNKQIDNLK